MAAKILVIIIGALFVAGGVGTAGLGWFAEGMSDAPGKTMGAAFYLGCAAAAALGVLLIAVS